MITFQKNRRVLRGSALWCMQKKLLCVTTTERTRIAASARIRLQGISALTPFVMSNGRCTAQSLKGIDMR